MTISPEGYYDCLKSHLKTDFYAVNGFDREIKLREKIDIGVDRKKKEIVTTLIYSGSAFAIKLDRKNTKGNHDRLFHFLEDTNKPWAKRCDFIVFHLNKSKICAHLIEYKWETISSDSVIAQLKSSEAWCRSLTQIIKNYTGISKKIHLRKYVLTRHPDPSPYLEEEGKYLKGDQSVRHYHYKDINGMALEDLDNSSVIAV